MLAAASFLAGSSQSVDVAAETVVAAPSDKRAYRGLTLDNGIKVMLISDPTAVTASAALDLNAGAASDPDDRPGLAHFCEHMLFLSTKKYPKENEYFKHLAQHGGGANAFTAFMHTNYFFYVQPEKQEETLDRFAQFFVAPLFNEEAVGRELHAVASEHSKNLQSDPWRKRQLLKSFSNPKHPYSKFSTGSIDTLLPDNSSASVKKLHRQLVEWYNSTYSANLMALAVSGKQNLSVLQEWVVDKFSAVPRRAGVERPDFAAAPRPYDAAALPMGYAVKPVKQQQEVTLQWLLPGVENLTESKPLRTVGFLLGGESKGSLLSLLIDKGWAEGLLAGAGDAESDFSIFEMRVQLTPAGVQNWTKVVGLCFAAIGKARRGMAEHAEAERVHKLVHDVDFLGFNYKEEEEASGYTSDVASNLHLYSHAQALMGPAVTTAHNTSQMLGLLDQLTPQRLILLQADYNASALPGAVEHERWYNTEYSRLALPAQALQWWSDSLHGTGAAAGAHAELTLPEDNAFLPDDFTLLAQPASSLALAARPDEDKPAVEPPNLLFNNSEGTLWHRTETSFGLPMGAMHVLWTVPRVAQSARGAVMAQMLELMVREQLRALSYDAGVAGSAVAFGAGTRGFELSAYGFSQRVPVLLATLLDNVVNLQADGDAARRRFQTQKSMLTRGLKDASKQSPQAFASQISQHLTRRVYYLPQQLLSALEPLTLAELANFTRRVTREDATGVEGLVLGNHDGKSATAMLANTTRRLVARELPCARRPRQAVANLAGRALVHTFRHPNGNEPNSAVQLVAQIGRLEPRQAAVAELLNDMLKQPFFDELRTNQQLGYIVGSGLSAPQAVYSMGFVVQSAVQPPAEVSRRILAFLRSAPQLLADAKDEFPNYVAAAQTQLREPPKRLSQAADMLWPRVSEATYRFEWPQRVARAMDNVTLADVQAMLQSLLKTPEEGGVGRLLIMVHGKEHALPSASELHAKIGPLASGPTTGWAHVGDAVAFNAQRAFFTDLAAQLPFKPQPPPALSEAITQFAKPALSDAMKAFAQPPAPLSDAVKAFATAGAKSGATSAKKGEAAKVLAAAAA